MSPVIDPHHRNTALLVAGCFFMENLDGTIVTTAAPAIGRSLHAPATDVGLVVTAYLLTLAVLIPLSGWLTRRLGTRVVFLAAIVVFTLASVGCATSVSLGELVAMRVLQGAGGAMMVPVGRTMVLSGTDKQDLIRVVAYIVWPGLLAPVIAPLAGGLIVTYASWHWLFLINAPLGVVAFAAAWRLIPAGRDALTGRGTGPAAKPPPLDWAGVVLTCTGLGGLTYAAHLVSVAGSAGASWGDAASAGGASALLLAASVWHLRRNPHPLLSLKPLRVPTFRVSQTGGFLYWLVVGAGPFLLPLLFQTQFGWSPVKSGAVVLFIFVGNIGIKPATTPLINRFGFRALLVAATACMAVAMAALGFTTPATPVPVIAALALVSGVARSAALTVYNTVAFADIEPGEMRDANVLSATTTQLAAGLAVAAATVALRVGGPIARLLGLAPAHSPGRTAYTVAFCLLAVIALAAAAEAARLHPGAGDSVRQARPAVDRGEATEARA
jgi:MFS family permease